MGNKKSINWYLFLIILLLIIITNICTAYFGIHNKGISQNSNDWDRFAAILSPIITAISIIILSLSLRAQTKAVNNQIQANKEQQNNNQENISKLEEQIKIQKESNEFDTAHRIIEEYRKRYTSIDLQIQKPKSHIPHIFLKVFYNNIPIEEWNEAHFKLLFKYTSIKTRTGSISFNDHCYSMGITVIDKQIKEFKHQKRNCFLDELGLGCINKADIELCFSQLSGDDKYILYQGILKYLYDLYNELYPSLYKLILSYIEIVNSFSNSGFREIFFKSFSDFEFLVFLAFIDNNEMYSESCHRYIFGFQYEIDICGIIFPIIDLYKRDSYQYQLKKLNTILEWAKNLDNEEQIAIYQSEIHELQEKYYKDIIKIF